MASFTVDPRSLHRLRDRLQQTEPAAARGLLHQAGYASGELLASRWLARLNELDGLDQPEVLDTRWFGPLLSEVTSALGWGTLSISNLSDKALQIESADWAEANEGATAGPSCQFTEGALSAFLTKQAGASISVMEVECRATGADLCRFVAGSQEIVSLLWDLVSAGQHWRNAFPKTNTD